MLSSSCPEASAGTRRTPSVQAILLGNGPVGCSGSRLFQEGTLWCQRKKNSLSLLLTGFCLSYLSLPWEGVHLPRPAGAEHGLRGPQGVLLQHRDTCRRERCRGKLLGRSFAVTVVCNWPLHYGLSRDSEIPHYFAASVTLLVTNPPIFVG